MSAVSPALSTIFFVDARCYVGYSTAGHGDFSRSLWLLWASFEALRIPYWLNDLSVLGSVISVAQDAAGQRAAMLAVFEQHLAVDDRHMNALRRLLDSLGAGREVVQHFQRQRLHRVGVEDHDIGDHARPQQAAVVEPEDRGRFKGEPAHRRLQ